MKEKTSIVLVIIVGLIGVGVGYVLGAVNSPGSLGVGSVDVDAGHTHTGMEDAMHDMTDALAGKTGAAFDQAFLEQMIVHHAGAVDMAAMVQHQSSNPELKAFAQAIAVAQTKEIQQMRAWQQEWNLMPAPDVSVSSDGNAHGGGGYGGSASGQTEPGHAGSGVSGYDGDMVACTMEAKICPDGSAVGRQGPRCEFAKCPGE